MRWGYGFSGCLACWLLDWIACLSACMFDRSFICWLIINWLAGWMARIKIGLLACFLACRLSVCMSGCVVWMWLMKCMLPKCTAGGLTLSSSSEQFTSCIATERVRMKCNYKLFDYANVPYLRMFVPLPFQETNIIQVKV